MPFILLAGWLLAGVEASPGDLAFTVQSTVMLGLGFAFLLAIFPLFNWIPQVMEESSPYVAGFLLWLLPTIVLVFAMSFLDRYAWLRTSAQITGGLRIAGAVMLVSGAWWAAFERHVGRLMAYTVIAETGFLLLALGLATSTSTSLVFLLLIPRGLGVAVWSLALSVLRRSQQPLELGSMQGMARSYPFACAAIILAALSSAGFPLLGGFPGRLALWQALSTASSGISVWYLVGLVGLLVGAVRQLAVYVTQNEEGAWKAREDIIQRGMLGIGSLALFALGVFPRLPGFVAEKLPLMFLHLNR
jgi:formate hydrogenlyase subunit 3/multisubunit Na+/H+ antiporter MnhD subunit